MRERKIAIYLQAVMTYLFCTCYACSPACPAFLQSAYLWDSPIEEKHVLPQEHQAFFLDQSKLAQIQASKRRKETMHQKDPASHALERLCTRTLLGSSSRVPNCLAPLLQHQSNVGVHAHAHATPHQ